MTVIPLGVARPSRIVFVLAQTHPRVSIVDVKIPRRVKVGEVYTCYVKWHVEETYPHPNLLTTVRLTSKYGNPGDITVIWSVEWGEEVVTLSPGEELNLKIGYEPKCRESQFTFKVEFSRGGRYRLVISVGYITPIGEIFVTDLKEFNVYAIEEKPVKSWVAIPPILALAGVVLYTTYKKSLMRRLVRW